MVTNKVRQLDYNFKPPLFVVGSGKEKNLATG
jgi:hypothetical protein